MRSVLLSVLVIWIAMLAGCGPRPPITGTGGTAGTGGTGPGGDGGGGGGGSVFTVSSTAFAQGAAIPPEHQCTAIAGGQNLSPPLSWTAGPAGTQSYAIVMKDTGISFNHWVIWDIPASTLSLPAGVENTFQPASVSGAKQAPLNANLVGYFGMCSPTTVNTYEFRVYALPVANVAGLSQQSTMAEAEAAIAAQASASTAIAGQS